MGNRRGNKVTHDNVATDTRPCRRATAKWPLPFTGPPGEVAALELRLVEAATSPSDRRSGIAVNVLGRAEMAAFGLALASSAGSWQAVRAPCLWRIRGLACSRVVRARVFARDDGRWHLLRCQCGTSFRSRVLAGFHLRRSISRSVHAIPRGSFAGDPGRGGSRSSGSGGLSSDGSRLLRVRSRRNQLGDVVLDLGRLEGWPV